MKSKEKIKQLSHQIVILEKQCQRGINVQENINKMTNLLKDLSPEDLFELDEYILENMLKS